MQSFIGINADEGQWLLQDTNEPQTLWTARLVHVSGFQWCKKDTFASEHSNVMVTVVPTFVKGEKSYKQMPESKFCGIQQVHLIKESSQVISSQEEVSRISREERLKFSLRLKNDLPALVCVLIDEQGEIPGEYLYICPPAFDLSKLCEIVDRPCKSVLERMLLLAISAMTYSELESLTYLYNYCENAPLLNSTPTMIGDIALLTALQLAGVDDAEVPPQNNILSPIQNLVSRLIDTIVTHAQSKFRPKDFCQKTLHKLFENSTPLVSFYMELDSWLFCPLKLKTDAKALLYSTPQLVRSFILFLVMFPIYGSRKIIRCDEKFFRPSNKDKFSEPTSSRWFVFLSYFSLFLSVASIAVYYILHPSDVDDGRVQIWIPFILTFYTLVFAHMSVGAIHTKFSMPRFTSIKLSHDKAQMLVLRRSQTNRINDLTERDAENREFWSVDFDISWIKQEYMNRSTFNVHFWYVAIALLFLMAPGGQIILFESYHSKKGNASMPWFMHGSISAKLIYGANVITTESTAIVLVICALFYFNAYFMIKGILEKAQANDYAESNVSNEFDVRKPESLEYLLTLIRVMIGSINHSLPNLIMIGCTVLVIFCLAFVALIIYIHVHSPVQLSVLSCAIYTIILAVPSVIILIKIALINTMVTQNLLEILQDHKQRLINQIVNEQLHAVDSIPKLITARDYLNEQIKLLTSQGAINTVKLLGLLPINLSLLISLGLTAGGSVVAYFLSLGKQ